MYTRHEKKRVLKELLDQINPRGHAQTNGSKTRSKMRYPFHTKHMHCSPTNNNNNNTNNPFSLSLSLFKKGILPALNAKEGNLCLEYYICARALERMCGLKDLKKIFFFPLLRVKGAEAQKNTFRVTANFFFGLSAQKFLVFRSAPLWKKEAQKEET